MRSSETMTAHPTALKILRMLEGHDDFQPSASQQIFEEVLVRQAANFLDEALPWQRGHGRRTARIARSLGAAAGLSREAMHHLTLAALLHDIGLLALPSNLASHTDYLDVQSYAARQSHPRLGAQWLERYQFLQQASVIIAHHHERWDGSGYPYGIRGIFIPVESRVLAIADAFDAIEVPGVNDRKVRDHVACRILTAAAGTQFDPQLVELCRQAYTGRLNESNRLLTA